MECFGHPFQKVKKEWKRKKRRKDWANFFDFNYYVDENYQTLIIFVPLSTELLDTFGFEFQHRELKQGGF